MVIGFNKQFVSRIKAGTKIHTIREDKHNRWKVGIIMHMATGVRTKKYKQFAKKKCIHVQKISIKYYSNYIHVKIGGRVIPDGEVIRLACNDGFRGVKYFKEWFSKDFTGKIIHWTDKKY